MGAMPLSTHTLLLIVYRQNPLPTIQKEGANDNRKSEMFGVNDSRKSEMFEANDSRKSEMFGANDSRKVRCWEPTTADKRDVGSQ